MNRAVVTGASGAVGYGLIKALLSENIGVTVLGRSKPEIDGVDYIYCELDGLKSFDAELTADAFFHLAWNGTYGADRNDMQAQYKNVDYTLDAVRFAKKLGCRAFVGVGSQAEYGAVEYGVKLTPELACNPESYYGKAKLEACRKARELCDELDIKFNWCRIISAYGIGDKPYTMVMQTIAKFVRGESCDFTPCDQIWDYMNNEDVGRALLMTAKNGKNGRVYVLGSGSSAPLKSYVMKIYDAVSNNEAKCNFGALAYYENQAMYLSSDISALTADTGFVPKISFDEGIRATVEWYKQKYI
ncbi:MAG: NAD(P)-dependent oxidoreductase [Eubacterium sp.]|nr:NAD(P)-dependent oxidoreductase [Eubacterium sp.]